MQMTRNTDAVLQQGEATLGMVADAFYFDLTGELGEAPGQQEAFELLLDQLKGEAAEIWYGAMMGFGLALAADCGAETSAAVIHAASAFLVALDDESE